MEVGNYVTFVNYLAQIYGPLNQVRAPSLSPADSTLLLTRCENWQGGQPVQGYDEESVSSRSRLCLSPRSAVPSRRLLLTSSPPPPSPLRSRPALFIFPSPNSVDTEQLADLLNEEKDIVDRPDSKELVVAEGAKIEFDNVKFSYDGKKDIIKGISFSIEPGQSVALVGPSGGGKSTVRRKALLSRSARKELLTSLPRRSCDYSTASTTSPRAVSRSTVSTFAMRARRRSAEPSVLCPKVSLIDLPRASMR